MFTERLEFNPSLLALHANDSHTFPYLLQSCGDQGWDILLALPQTRRVFWDQEGAAFFQAIGALPVYQVPNPENLPFLGGWFVYLGYDLLSELEPTVPSAYPDSFPLAALTRIPAALLFHRASKVTWLMAETLDQHYQLQTACTAIADFCPKPVSLESLIEDPAVWYTDAVAKLKAFIRAGDVFQVNISRGWQAQLSDSLTAADVFAALQQANPAPFSALVDFGDAQIISSSPERLVRACHGWGETRPIAGTYPRSIDPNQDILLKQQLIHSTKERAEHVMLVDLARNDLGRIALPGTVEVDEWMVVTSYAYVHHIESNIRARLRPLIHPIEVLRAMFPGGTITGCPKVRTMQIIRALEPTARRAYTGSLGYLNRDGSMDLNILIRTLMKEGPQLRFRAGGGIVADSDPESELMETRHKARGLLRALGVEAAVC